jgi:hypothetical protein
MGGISAPYSRIENQSDPSKSKPSSLPVVVLRLVGLCVVPLRFVLVNHPVKPLLDPILILGVPGELVVDGDAEGKRWLGLVHLHVCVRNRVSVAVLDVHSDVRAPDLQGASAM